MSVVEAATHSWHVDIAVKKSSDSSGFWLELVLKPAFVLCLHLSYGMVDSSAGGVGILLPVINFLSRVTFLLSFNKFTLLQGIKCLEMYAVAL